MEDAKAFFTQLKIFSDRYVKQELGISSATSPWGQAKFKAKPKGAIIHFTADEDPHRVLRWFIKKKFNARVSAHTVVFDRRMGCHSELAADLPLILELPTTIVQCRKPTQVAYHATWTNGTCYGIENVNAGELRKTDKGGYCSWRPRDKSAEPWTMPWSAPHKAPPVELYGKHWSPYPPDQIRSNVILLRQVQALFGSLQKSWIVGHEQVQSIHTKRSGGTSMGTDKRDSGAHFPIHGVREAMFDDEHIDFYDWFKHYENDHRYGESTRDALMNDYANYTLLFDDRNQPAKLWKHYHESLEDLLYNDGYFGSLGKLGLKILGYHVATPFEETLTAEDIQAVCIFQRMMGIKCDGAPGKITLTSLLHRLQDRGFIPYLSNRIFT